MLTILSISSIPTISISSDHHANLIIPLLLAMVMLPVPLLVVAVDLAAAASLNWIPWTRTQRVHTKHGWMNKQGGEEEEVEEQEDA